MSLLSTAEDIAKEVEANEKIRNQLQEKAKRVSTVCSKETNVENEFKLYF